MNYQQLKKIVGFYSRFTASFTQGGTSRAQAVMAGVHPGLPWPARAGH